MSINTFKSQFSLVIRFELLHMIAFSVWIESSKGPIMPPPAPAHCFSVRHITGPSAPPLGLLRSMWHFVPSLIFMSCQACQNFQGMFVREEVRWTKGPYFASLRSNGSILNRFIANSNQCITRMHSPCRRSTNGTRTFAMEEPSPSMIQGLAGLEKVLWPKQLFPR
jgi:hypothetical protein